MGREVEVLKFEHCPTLFTVCRSRKKNASLYPSCTLTHNEAQRGLAVSLEVMGLYKSSLF